MNPKQLHHNLRRSADKFNSTYIEPLEEYV